jgi:putative ABC transport system permease protein
MRWLRRVIGGAHALVRRRQVEEDLDEELRGYLESSVEEKMRGGMGRTEAMRAARLETGLVSGVSVRDHVSDVGWEVHVERFWQDVRHAGRALRRNRGFAFVAVLTLALGVGVNTAIFSVVNAVMLRPLPFGSPNRLVRIYESNAERGWLEFSASDPNFLDWRAQAVSWEALAAFQEGTVSVTTGASIDLVPALGVTPGFLAALGMLPVLGRDFREEEVRPGGNPNVTVISDGLWRRVFGADPGVVGTSVRLNDEPHTIIGVLPAGFDWGETELLRPRTIDPGNSRSDHQLGVIGLLKPHVTLAEARAELTTIASRLAAEYPKDNAGWTVNLVTFYDWLVPQQVRRSLVVLQGAVLLVLLIACINVANLLLARGAAREKELAIRAAVAAGGASRWRLVWHGLMESCVLAFISAAAGVGLASMTVRVLSVYAAAVVPRVDEASIDWTVLGFALGCALVSAVTFGLLPSLHAARDLEPALHDSSRGATGGRARQRIRASLTVAEVSLSVALLIGAGLLLRSLSTLQRVDAGFDIDAVMTGRVMLASNTAFDSLDKRTDFWRRVTAEVATLPGVTRVSAGSGIPFAPGGTPNTEIAVPGAAVNPGVQSSANWRVIAPGYFGTMGIPLRGRDFTDADGPEAPPVIIVSEALARAYWPNDDPVGKTLVVSSLGNRARTVIGVAGDLRRLGLDDDIRPMVYYPVAEVPVFGQMYLVWRSSVDPQSQVPAVRNAIRRVSGQVAFHDVSPAVERLSDSFGSRRLNLYLFGLFAVVALALAAIGLFGVMAYLVSQRTREIGVRLALGAPRGDVCRVIIGRGVALAAAGAMLGVVGAAWSTRLMEGLLFSVSRTDPVTFVLVPIAMVCISVVACYVPARRAMRVDPVIALRAE